MNADASATGSLCRSRLRAADEEVWLVAGGIALPKRKRELWKCRVLGWIEKTAEGAAVVPGGREGVGEGIAVGPGEGWTEGETEGEELGLLISEGIAEGDLEGREEGRPEGLD